MAQDIRKMLQGYEPESKELSQGHEARFEDRLDMAFSEKRKHNIPWLRIAAIVITFIGVSVFGYVILSKGQSDSIVEATPQEETDVINDSRQITLGDLSPDLKKVEDFYLTGINVQLASLDENDENKELIDGYLNRLDNLNTEYAVLNDELNKIGPTEATINALIDNLQLRLELLFKLKNKLKELKKSENEQFNSNIG